MWELKVMEKIARMGILPWCDKHTENCPRVNERAGAAAKLLQSCQTLWDPIDGSPQDSPIPGILQARILEWVAIFFSIPMRLGVGFSTYAAGPAPISSLKAKYGGGYWIYSAFARKHHQNWCGRTSLVVQWLTLCASTTGGTGSIPGRGTKISHATVQPKTDRQVNKKLTWHSVLIIYNTQHLKISVFNVLFVQLYTGYVFSK